jgi:hypothetical protein
MPSWPHVPGNAQRTNPGHGHASVNWKDQSAYRLALMIASRQHRNGALDGEREGLCSLGGRFC